MSALRHRTQMCRSDASRPGLRWPLDLDWGGELDNLYPTESRLLARRRWEWSTLATGWSLHKSPIMMVNREWEGGRGEREREKEREREREGGRVRKEKREREGGRETRGGAALNQH